MIDNKNYVMTYEDLKKIVYNEVNKGSLKHTLALYLLRFNYRNSYGTIHGDYGLNSEFNYNYPKNLVDELDIPVSTYGFTNLELSNDMKNNKYQSRTSDVYNEIDYNLDDIRREDLIKHLKYMINLINERSDFNLVDFCHERQLFLDYRENKVDLYEKNNNGYIKGNEDILYEDDNRIL